MIQTKPNDSHKELHDEKSLKGTLFSVGVLAAVIVVMWVTVFWIYMDRV
ncbi:cytochrome c oxidase subunit 2A [Aquibacillus rhizosphaerae]|uniref:Cytochrome c oxidase subunit 2A n=1 Tax=Aquibacillus rhizosphaerae TaxID=3051431 RepID=A0ABT7L180_9BACI|nr:cytochrome c oxidase subunit 2A [Aquibacillus sp. LR5S19]MDL4839604.1 cytochrome c oxidase subunit 2A [Aquibacillus sp. LR5S19]